MRKRKPDTKGRGRILRRDEGCVKCFGCDDLHVHHKVARQDGGTDDSTNLVTLCQRCHKEWHFAESIMEISFEQWMQIPPYIGMVALFLDEEYAVEREGAFVTVRMLRGFTPTP